MKAQLLAGIMVGSLLLFLGWMIPDTAARAENLENRTVDTPAAMPSATPEQERRIQEFVVHQSSNTAETTAASVDAETQVCVLVSGEETEMTLRDYLVGVVMAEMPAEFQLEALKAQAVAARTYTLSRLAQGGMLSDDPAVCQAFIPPERAQEKLGENWENLLWKLRCAVEETDGEVLLYDGALISATYFSCSGGTTEDAAAVWGGDVPYLVSVDSPGEEMADAYESEAVFSYAQLEEMLEIDTISVGDVTYTDGGGVAEISIGGKTFSGTQLRKRLGLRSTKFTMELAPETVTFYVLGNGHRVGMSQYGANAMAQAGKSYEEILKWYYTGVELREYDI